MRVTDLAQLKEDLGNSGHCENIMEELEPLVVQRATENELYEHRAAQQAVD